MGDSEKEMEALAAWPRCRPAPAWDCREERASRTQRQTDQANAWKAIRRGRKIL